jgi:glycosyltransferase involved in cell wall biosynthesis
MIYFDVTNAHRSRHKSGLLRVSARLLSELGAKATPVVWRHRQWFKAADIPKGGAWRLWLKPGLRPLPVQFGVADWLFTPEVFAPDERPGFAESFVRKEVRKAVLFHDAIPLKFPHITWPRSVARHAPYMGMLAEFDHVFAVSQASAEEIGGFWRWQGRLNLPKAPPPVTVLPLGADFNGQSRRIRTRSEARPPPVVLCTGILEPRKNQVFLIEVCEALWSTALLFELHFVGRVNPHFGRPVLAAIQAARRRGRPIHHHHGLDDDGLSALYARTRVTAFPTMAEGCGLPLLESLWQGVPCLCSDLPVLRENADCGGCVSLPLDQPESWQETLRSLLTTDMAWGRLAQQAGTRPLPTWHATQEALRSALTTPKRS